MAHFEIHVLNYNGLRFLGPCLSALANIEHAGHRVSINVVDNGSTDASQEFVATNFPNVSFIALESNLGFTEGNNQGSIIAAARARERYGCSPDYDVFLNNDTEVARDWLAEAARVLESEPEVGIVGSKALFMDRFVALNIKVSPPFKPSEFGSTDSRILGCFVNSPLSGENLKSEAIRFRWKNAFGQQAGGRWLAPQSSILIPVLDEKKESGLDLSLRFAPEQSSQTEVEFYVNNSSTPVLTRTCGGGQLEEFNFNFSQEDYVAVIQNMGNFITKDWEAGDLHFGEIDSPQNSAPREVPAICGVSMFIRHALFVKLKGFDSNYFAYFEDADLSVRAQLAGYKCKIVPTSVLYHLHCGSSGGEWSATFSRLVAFSHLLFSSKFAGKHIWDSRLKELKRAAKEQFEVYLSNNNLESTPQLRAYLSYLKKPHVFWKNRLLHRRFAAQLEKFPFLDSSS